MKKHLCLGLFALSLAACAGPKPQALTNKQILDAMPGPNIEGMTDTMESDAKAAVARGDYNKAGQLYRQLIDHDGKNQAYLLGYADAARRGGHYDQAELSFSELLKMSPENLDAKEGRGLTLLGENKFEDAGLQLSEVQKADPKRWRVANGLGLLFVHKNMYDEALAYFAEALKQSPNNASVLNNVGLTQAVQKNFPDATTALAKASDLAQTKVLKQQIDLNRAMVYGVAGDMDTAKQLASKYLSGPELDNNLGLYAYLADNDMMAKSYLNMALTESPRYYDRAWKNLSAVSGDAGVESGDKGKGKRIKIQ